MYFLLRYILLILALQICNFSVNALTCSSIELEKLGDGYAIDMKSLCPCMSFWSPTKKGNYPENELGISFSDGTLKLGNPEKMCLNAGYSTEESTETTTTFFSTTYKGSSSTESSTEPSTIMVTTNAGTTNEVSSTTESSTEPSTIKVTTNARTTKKVSSTTVSSTKQSIIKNTPDTGSTKQSTIDGSTSTGDISSGISSASYRDNILKAKEDPTTKPSTTAVVIILLTSLFAGCLFAYATKVIYKHYKSKEYQIPPDQEMESKPNGDLNEATVEIEG